MVERLPSKQNVFAGSSPVTRSDKIIREKRNYDKYTPKDFSTLNYLLAPIFGNVTLTIGIDSGDKVINKVFGTAKELFETAFYKNPVLAYVVVPDTSFWVPFTYVVFKNCVVQFFNDNLNDPHGVISTLYQDIAKEIFADMPFPQDGGICYCTDVEYKLGAPLGEWP